MRKFVRLMMAGVAAFGLPVLAAGTVRAESLADALIAAYNNSHLLEQNQAVLRAADEDFATAIASLRPVVSYLVATKRSHAESSQPVVTPGGGIDYTPYVDSLNTQFVLTAQYTLYDFGRTTYNINIAREAVLSARAALVGVEQDVLLSAVSAYVDVQLQAENLALRQSNVRLITQELRATKDRFDVGEVTLTDVALAEARLAAAKSQLASAEGALTLAREQYKSATGNYPGNLKGLPKAPVTAKSQKEATDIALRQHPAMLQVGHEVAVADLRVALSEANMQPTITAEAQVVETWTGSSFDDGLDSQSLSLIMSQTIYAGGRLSALYRKAIAGRDAARAGQYQTAVSVTENVGRAWSNIGVAVASIQAADQQINAAQAAYDGVKEEADLGARTTLDVLDAEQSLLDAKAARLQAEASLYVGYYSLLSSMGLLTVDHLKLGIPTYDPEAYFNAVKKAPAHSTQSEKLNRILETIGD